MRGVVGDKHSKAEGQSHKVNLLQPYNSERNGIEKKVWYAGFSKYNSQYRHQMHRN